MPRHRLRPIAAPFAVAPPSGARIRDRLRVSASDAEVLTIVGRHLGHHARLDLAERIRLGDVPANGTQRARRKKALTGVSSSRWAGAITRTSDDQYRLSMRCLCEHRSSLGAAIQTIQRRLAVEVGGRDGRVRGYATRAERWAKQRRLAVLSARLAEVQRRITAGRPAITIGGNRLLTARQRLADAHVTVEEWRRQWDAARLFLTADGESGAPFGNYTITVDPYDGSVTLVLPRSLRRLANAPRGRYRLAGQVSFHHRRDEWVDRAAAHRAVRYDISYDARRDRWYLDASWAVPAPAPTALKDLTAAGAQALGVDLNADHLAAHVLDSHGNPVGRPHTIGLDLTGPAPRRDGRLRAAITTLVGLAKRYGCSVIAIEDLGFDEARAVGRETLGRGRRGKRFRRSVAGVPTARFRDRLRGMAYHAGLTVVAVDPAYTSRWGGQHWNQPLRHRSTIMAVTRHHAASVAIGRRALGHRVRRRPGVPAHHQSDGGRRATGQAALLPRARGGIGPPRTSGSPPRGCKTRTRPSDLRMSPGLEHRSRGHPGLPGTPATATARWHGQER